MNEFETQLMKFKEEGETLESRKREHTKMGMSLEQDYKLYQEKFNGFMKEHGLSDNTVFAEFALFCIRKARQ